MKKCPYCAEMIQEESVLCSYCRHNLENSVEDLTGEYFNKTFIPQVSEICFIGIRSTNSDPNLANSPALSQYELKVYRIIQSP